MDLWPLYLFHPGAVTVNFAVNVFARCKIKRLPGRKIRLISRDGGLRELYSNLAELCVDRERD